MQTTSEATVNSDGIQLFKFVPNKERNRREWSLVSGAAQPRFYDANADRPSLSTKWKLEIEAGNIDEEISHALSAMASSKEQRVTFKTGSCDVWALRFPNLAFYQRFWSEYNNKLFENTYGDSNTRENRERHFGRDFAEKLFSDKAGEEMDWEHEDAVPKAGPSAPQASKKSAGAGEGDITLLKMGIGEHSYLVRGDRMDVLLNGEGGVEDKSVAFRVKKADGSSVKPWKVMLAEGERRMGMLSLQDRKTFHYADLETGKVIREWTFEKDGVKIPMTDIVNETKAAPIENRSSFLSFDTDRICRWDTRDPDGVVQEYLPKMDYLSGKDYGKGTNFNCMAVSGDGSVAVGSNDGKIRLYSNKLTLGRASTAFPGIGVPITHIDVSFDGRWVVATTDHFLEVVKTDAKNEDGKELNGFVKSISAHASMPRLLKLKPEDEIQMNHAPFRKGRFTFVTQSNHQERWIVASCGQYSVLWNFRHVKAGHLDVRSHGGMQTCMTYHLISKESPVVDSCFLHEKHQVSGDQSEAALVVATPNKVWSFSES